MNLKIEENERAHLRWEFVRRNEKYKVDYNSRVFDQKIVVDPKILKPKVISFFLKKYFIYPINPSFSFDKVVKKYKSLSLKQDEVTTEKNKLYEERLGKKSGYYRHIDYYYTKYRQERDVKLKNIYKQEFTKYLSVNWKVEVKEVVLEVRKVEAFIKKEPLKYNLSSEESALYKHLMYALHKLDELKLSDKHVVPGQMRGPILKSYLTGNSDIVSSDWELGYGAILVDKSITDVEKRKALFEYGEDISKISIDIDLSYPAAVIKAHLEAEISKWEKIKTFYQKKDTSKQTLNFDEFKNRLLIYDLKENEGLKYKEIAKKVFPYFSDDTETALVQKVSNWYKRAKEYIEGKYQQIR